MSEGVIFERVRQHVNHLSCVRTCLKGLQLRIQLCELSDFILNARAYMYFFRADQALTSTCLYVLINSPLRRV